MIRVTNLTFATNLKFTTSEILVNITKKIMFCLNISVFQFNKPKFTVQSTNYLNSFILLVIQHVAKFRDAANSYSI